MKNPMMIGLGSGAAALLLMTGIVVSRVKAAETRLKEPDKAQEAVAVADHAEEAYCTPAFKTVLQRVLNACGLVGQESRRGCQPGDVKTFASIDDDDFNALFTPLVKRGGIVMFDEGKEDIDDGARRLVEQKWNERKGARYFFIVARASKTGSVDKNRSLSHRRANSVQYFLKEKTNDPDLDSQVGMLWLGSEFAQLGKDYCDTWENSRGGQKCDTETVNRSAFVSWVDCRL